MKLRTYELAKELNLEPKDLITKAKAGGISIRSNLATLEDDTVAALRKLFAGHSPEGAEDPAKKKAGTRVTSMIGLTARKPKEEAESTAAQAPADAAPIPATTATASPVAAVESAAKAKEPSALEIPRMGAPGRPATSRLTVTPALPIKPHHAPKAVPAPPPKPEPKPVEVPREEREAAKRVWQEKTAAQEPAKEVRALRPQEMETLAKEQQQQQAARVRRRPAGMDRNVRGGRGRTEDHSRTRSRRFDPAAMERLQAASAKTVAPEAPSGPIEIALPIMVKDLSGKLGVKVSDIQRKLIELGMFVTINDPLPQDAIALLAGEFKKDIVFKQAKGLEDDIKEEIQDRAEDLVPRAPVVTIMGHVDHGKTSLLDRIRKANVAASEFGGITQHIGAYTVHTPNGRRVVFLDTPGHEAFTAMRARGANITDIAVLVVAADDGVMPQTEEAINHARAAEVPIVVALNKCDKPEANPQRVMHQLAQLQLSPEEWGGSSGFVPVSAITGIGVDKLLERILLEAEILELKANPNRPAVGAVIEAYLTEGKGVTANVLIQSGTIRRGDIVICGTAYGRIRNIYDEHGGQLAEAGPATPVEIIGLSSVPQAGETLHVLPDMQRARMIAEDRERKLRVTALLERKHLTLENLFHRIAEGQIKEIRVILKADVKGSAEVLVESLRNVGTKEVTCRVIHSAVGNVNESDVLLADASDAIVIGFNVTVESRAKSIAQEKGVDVRNYQVIYAVIDEMKAALQGLLEPEEVEVVLGHVGVKELFNISKVGVIAGCLVTDGKIERSSKIRQIREAKVVHTGKLSSLKRFKDDVKEVTEGFECGIKLEGRDDLKPGDVLEAFTIQLVPRKL